MLYTLETISLCSLVEFIKTLYILLKACRQYLFKISYFKNSWAARWNPLYYHHSQKIMMLSRFVFFVTPERVLLLTLFSTERTENSVQSDFVYPDHISFSELLLTSFLRYLLNNLIRAVSKQKKRSIIQEVVSHLKLSKRLPINPYRELSGFPSCRHFVFIT